MSNMQKTAGVALIAVVGLLLAPPLSAQEAEPTSNESAEVTTEVLERMATVYPTVLALAEEATPRIEEAETHAVAEALRHQLVARISAVLATADLTLGEYTDLVAHLNQNEEDRERFQRVLNRVLASAIEQV